ncbi:DUF3888 domain-containing protein [Halobacillus sp. BBL2006]|uniref:DUF3888 domain-containing protein n=1 Tax=Halobacillus sp. BBL2006 TaxID=1543706 RepID=UPI000542860A|nr:DUF3888 domain-containing protein [Halobacillus sp. BBL2006]KHE73190.1 hypothetical protein LD39_00515 [Halobacillus sp. BBL2006]
MIPKTILSLVLILIILNPVLLRGESKQIENDVILSLLTNKIIAKLSEEFNQDTQFDCASVTKLEKTGENNNLYRVSLTLYTFEGPHNPPFYKVKMAFTNDTDNWRWEGYIVEKAPLEPNEKISCN